jgi:hypothetical protein
MLRDSPVVRLLPSPRSNWNEGHFQKNVVAWLKANQALYDAIYVDRADGLLSAIVAKASRWRKPVIARFSVDSDTQHLAKSQCLTPADAAETCRQCDRIVTPSAWAHRVLLSQGVDPKRIARIPDWVNSHVERTPEARRAASGSLFQVSSDFVVPGGTALILHYGRTEPESLLTLIRAVCDLLDQGVSVRMWVVASQASPTEIYDAIKDRGWHREILLFDGFDDLEELVAVSDLAIVSNPDTALQFSTPLFLNSDVPLIVADTPESKSWFPPSQPWKLYANSVELFERLRDWHVHRQQWEAEAIALRVYSHGHRQTANKSLDQWEQLLKPLSIESSR